MLNYLKRHSWILIVVLSVFLVPQSLNIQAELNERIIITGVAVDQSEGGYEITAQVVVPSGGSETEGSQTSVDVVSAKGTTVVEGVNKVSYLLGKTAGLSHVNFILISNEIATNGNMLSTMDYFLRNTKVPSSSLILIAPEKAKDELKKLKGMEVSTVVGLQKLFIYKQDSMNGTMMQLQDFMNNYFNLGRSGIISELKIEDEEKAGSENSSSSSGGGESGSSSNSSGESSSGGSGSSSSSGGSGGTSEQSKPRIKYYTPLHLFKDGVSRIKLEEEQDVMGINIVNPASKDGIISVENVNDEYYKNASVAILTKGKKVKYKASFDENNKPIFEVNITLNKNTVHEINNEQVDQNIYVADNIFLTDALIDALEKKITNAATTSFSKAREVGVDYLNIADRLYRANPHAWKKLLSSMSNNDDYLQQVDFKVNVSVRRYA